MGKRIVYLSGALEQCGMAGNPPGWRERAKLFLDGGHRGLRAFSPADYYSYDTRRHKTEREVLRFDINMLRRSHVVLTSLDGVRQSVGTCIEVYEAHRSGIPVVGFIGDDLPPEALDARLHPWVRCCVDRIESGEGALDAALSYIAEFYGR